MDKAIEVKIETEKYGKHENSSNTMGNLVLSINASSVKMGNKKLMEIKNSAKENYEWRKWSL